MLDLPPEGGPSSSSRRRPDLGARGRGLEIVGDALEGVVDAVELVLEQSLLRAHHVPHVLVAGARDAAAVGGKHALEEARERAGPVRGAVLFGKFAESADQAGAVFDAFAADSSDRHAHEWTLLFPVMRSDTNKCPASIIEMNAASGPTGL
jgi:hypothetical protein